MDTEDAGKSCRKVTTKEKKDDDTTEEGERENNDETGESAEQNGNSEHAGSEDIVVKEEQKEAEETKASSEGEGTEQEVMTDSVGAGIHQSEDSEEQRSEEHKKNEEPENSAQATVDVTKSEGAVSSDNADTDVATSGDATKSDDVSLSGDLKLDDVTESRGEESAVADNEMANDKEELQAEARSSTENWQSYYRSWNSFDWSGYSTCNNPTNAIRLSGRELAVVGVLCSFLHICPSGASEEEVAGFVQNQVKGVEKDLIRKLLTSLPMLFRAGDDKWRFCGFDSAQP